MHKFLRVNILHTLDDISEKLPDHALVQLMTLLGNEFVELTITGILVQKVHNFLSINVLAEIFLPNTVVLYIKEPEDSWMLKLAPDVVLIDHSFTMIDGPFLVNNLGHGELVWS